MASASKHQTTVLACFAALLTFSIATGAMAADPLPPVKTTCAPTNVSLISSTSQFSTTSNTLTQVGQTRVAFKQGGSTPSCVLVRFTANYGVAGANDYSQVRAVLNGDTAGRPGDAYYPTTGNYQRGATVEFFFPDVEPGKHNIAIFFASPQGGTVLLDQPLTVVLSAR